METPILEQPAETPKLSEPKRYQGHRLLKIFACLIILLLVLVWVKINFYPAKISDLAGSKNAWKAVFLTNGQVYFGKIVKEGRSTLVVRDVYYLQVQQLTPPAQEKDKEVQPQPQLTLIRLGEELHGPTNELRINREQVLFVETLRPDSNVVQTIEQAKKK